jgi:hypothetical protein
MSRVTARDVIHATIAAIVRSSSDLEAADAQLEIAEEMVLVLRVVRQDSLEFTAVELITRARLGLAVLRKIAAAKQEARVDPQLTQEQLRTRLFRNIRRATSAEQRARAYAELGLARLAGRVPAGD